jgi:hypothetical protein
VTGFPDLIVTCTSVFCTSVFPKSPSELELDGRAPVQPKQVTTIVGHERASEFDPLWVRIF